MTKKYTSLSLEINPKDDNATLEKTLRRFFEHGDQLNEYNTSILIDFISKSNKYSSFEDIKNDTKTPKNALWNKLKECADALTTAKLASLQTYISPIERTEIQTQIEAFLDSPTCLLPIVGEGGMGKTVAVAQWAGKAQKNEHYVVFFLQGNEIENHYFEYLAHLTPSKEQKFIIVLDAIDEITYKEAKTKNIATFFEKMIQRFQSNFEGQNWLKIIITSRPITWGKYAELWANIGELISPKIVLNTLSRQAVENILQQNLPTQHLSIFDFPQSLLETLKTPLYARFFIQIQEKLEESIIENTLDLFQKFIDYFIYSGAKNREKQAIIDFLLAQNSYGKEGRKVDKKLLQQNFNIHAQKDNIFPAFQFLCDAGILKPETLKYNGNLSKHNIIIDHSKIFQYLVFSYIISTQKPVNIFDYILQNYGHDIELKFEILSFSLQYCYQKNDIQTLEKFYVLALGTDFMYFWEINYGLAYQYPEVAEKIWKIWAKNTNAQTYFFEIFTNFKHITKGNLAGAWAHYQTHKTNLEAQIFSHAVLLKTYLLKNDKIQAEKHYEALLAFEPDNTIHPYPIARRWAYMRQYEHWVGRRGFEDLEETDGLAYQTQANLPTQIGQKQDLELYLFYESLICQTLNAVGKAEEVLERIEKFTKAYPDFEASPKKIILEAEKMIAEISLKKRSFNEQLLEEVKRYYEQNVLWDIDELYLRLLWLSTDETHHETARKIAESVGFGFYEKITGK